MGSADAYQMVAMMNVLLVSAFLWPGFLTAAVVLGLCGAVIPWRLGKVACFALAALSALCCLPVIWLEWL